MHHNAKVMHHNAKVVHQKAKVMHHNAKVMHHNAKGMHHNARVMHHNTKVRHNNASNELIPKPCTIIIRLARYHTFMEIDQEIISTVILLPSADLFKMGCCQLQAKVCAQITG